MKKKTWDEVCDEFVFYKKDWEALSLSKKVKVIAKKNKLWANFQGPSNIIIRDNDGVVNESYWLLKYIKELERK